MNDEFYVAIDVEAFGKVLDGHPTAEIAAQIIDAETCLISERHDTPTFEAVIFNENDLPVEERCKTEFWMRPENKERFEFLLNAISDRSKSIRANLAAKQFLQWAEANLGDHKKVTIVTDTCGFDVGRFDNILKNEGTSLNYFLQDDEGKYRYTPQVDMDSYASGLADSAPPCKTATRPYESAFKALGVEYPDIPYKHTHRAADDAAFLGSVYAHLRKAAQKKKHLVTELE